MATVTVYTTGPECVRCTATMRALARRSISYVEVDIREHPAAQEYVTQELGYSQAPVVVVGDEGGQDHWDGYRPEHIARIARTLAPQGGRDDARP